MLKQFILRNRYFTIKNFIIVFFLSYFFIGFNIYKDYGISFDEETNRLYGLTNGNYILKKFLNENFYDKIFTEVTQSKFPEKIKVKEPTDLHDFFDKAYGVFFELPLATLEVILNIKDDREVFLFRHLITFIFFWFSLIYFYLLLKKIFNSEIISFLGVILLIINPRIFANSFYNSKDIVFLGLFVISNYYGFSLIQKKKIKNIVLFCFFSAGLINLRLFGAIVPIAIYVNFFIDNYKKKKFADFNYLIIFIVTLFFYFIFTPVLWENSLTNFLNIINHFSNLPEYHTLYNGKFVETTKTPWQYIGVWIIITTPLLSILLFISGIFIFFKFYLNKNIDHKIIYVLNAIIFYILVPYTIFNLLNITMYDGWRHLYYMYTIIIIISLFTIKYLFDLKYKNILFYLSILIILIIINIANLIKKHPHQNIYFNSFFIKKPLEKFEKDYWGLSDKQILETFTEIEKNENFYLYDYSGSMFKTSLKILKPNIRKKFINYSDNFSELQNYQGKIYFFLNNRHNPDYDLLKNYADTLFEIVDTNVIINGVYRFQDLDTYNLWKEKLENK